MSQIFKIRDSQGRFSTGGDTPTWSKTGKVWKRTADLSNHFTQLSAAGQKAYAAAGAEVVVYDMVVTSSTPVAVYIQAANTRAAERAAEDRRRIDVWKERAEREQLAKLIDRYGIPSSVK